MWNFFHNWLSSSVSPRTHAREATKINLYIDVYVLVSPRTHAREATPYRTTTLSCGWKSDGIFSTGFGTMPRCFRRRTNQSSSFTKRPSTKRTVQVDLNGHANRYVQTTALERLGLFLPLPDGHVRHSLDRVVPQAYRQPWTL